MDRFKAEKIVKNLRAKAASTDSKEEAASLLSKAQELEAKYLGRTSSSKGGPKGDGTQDFNFRVDEEFLNGIRNFTERMKAAEEARRRKASAEEQNAQDLGAKFRAYSGSGKYRGANGPGPTGSFWSSGSKKATDWDEDIDGPSMDGFKAEGFFNFDPADETFTKSPPKCNCQNCRFSRDEPLDLDEKIALIHVLHSELGPRAKYQDPVLVTVYRDILTGIPGVFTILKRMNIGFNCMVNKNERL